MDVGVFSSFLCIHLFYIHIFFLFSRPSESLCEPGTLVHYWLIAFYLLPLDCVGNGGCEELVLIFKIVHNLIVSPFLTFSPSVAFLRRYPWGPPCFSLFPIAYLFTLTFYISYFSNGQPQSLGWHFNCYDIPRFPFPFPFPFHIL